MKVISARILYIYIWISGELQDLQISLFVKSYFLFVDIVQVKFSEGK